jgi:hypothetical protein
MNFLPDENGTKVEQLQDNSSSSILKSCTTFGRINYLETDYAKAKN